MARLRRPIQRRATDEPTVRPPRSRPRAPASVAGLLATGGIGCVYQPLVDLDTGRVLGHESLLRGPTGTPWASPLTLLEAARAEGRLAELESASLDVALDGAEPAGATLFVNVEPSTLTEHPDVVLAALERRRPGIQVVVEITERALAADLAGVLAGAERLRAAGCAIALDDVGAEPESLAFIPLLRPEVVKLDLGLLRTLDDPGTITVAGAVRAYAEASGAEVVAEGIESAEDLTRAVVLGATLGQGWHWGRPTPRPGPEHHRPDRFVAHPVTPLLRTTPHELTAHRLPMRRAPKRLLLPVSRTLELAAAQARVRPLLMACFQRAEHFTPGTVRRYRDLATHLPFVGALARNMPPTPATGVHGAALAPDDALAREWTVVVLGAHEAVGLIAREEPGEPTTDDGERQFSFAVTHDRALVTAAAQALAGRLAPARG